MEKICFPHYSMGKFDSIVQALEKLRSMNYGWTKYLLPDIVQYNICYRDYLRKNGIEGLIELLIREAPRLKNEVESLQYLRDWWNRQKRLADYDIQCYHINDMVTILGHTFNGLEDVIRHRAIIGKNRFMGVECFRPSEINEYTDIHIGELYESYPIFDSSDLGDDRTYQNYIFRTVSVGETDMKETYGMPHGCNFCMVHENIPVHLLPILYYKGDGDYMIIAANKEYK